MKQRHLINPLDSKSESVRLNLKQPVTEVVNGETRIVSPIKAPITTRSGKVTGHVTLYWSKSLGYVSIPGAHDDDSLAAFNSLKGGTIQ
jgi:hypothetical protein